MSLTDFKNGLQNADQYLSAQHHVRLDLQGSVADVGRFAVKTEMSTSLKEIICSLLAGRGLKLPNVQLCLFLNIQELLGIPQLQSALRQGLNKLADGLQKFMDHTKIEEVLGRVNNFLSEINNIANMINFCSAPIDPIAIPNLLEQGMQSFLGAGQDIVNKIGQLVPGEIGGCSTPGSINCAAFSGGILGKICDNLADVTNGTADQNLINSLLSDIDDVVGDIDSLVDTESNLKGTYDSGGSEFTGTRTVNDTVGVLHNANDAGIQGNTRIANQLKSLYDQLGSYQVVANDGTVYNNIFETFIEPDLLRLLRQQDQPQPRIADRQPVVNYCGEIIGYTDVVTQEPVQQSGGSVPETITEPGFNAGGLDTDPVTSAQDIANSTSVSRPNSATVQTVGSTLTAVPLSNITPSSGKARLIRVRALAKQADGVNVAALTREALVDNSAENVTLVSESAGTTFNSGTGYDMTFSIVDNAFQISVQGSGADTVNWNVETEFQEI